MTELQHVYVTAHGSFASGAWVGEAAQFGLRLAIGETGAMPAKGSIFDLALNGDVVTDSGSTAGTHGTLTRTWTARRGPTGSTENADDGFQIDCAEDVWTFLDAVKAYTVNTFRWTHIKLAPIGASGATIGASSTYTLTTPLVGGGTSGLPPQCAVAVTMRANILGRRGRGRIYLPAITSNVLATDGTLSGTPQTTWRSSFVTLIDALQNLPGTPDFVPIVTVMSAGSASGVRPSEVRVGNQVDVIRSRREQVSEIYGTTAL